MYSGPDRTQRLIAGAKREGMVSVYSSLTIDDMKVFGGAFEKKYGIKLQVWRSSSEDILQRAVVEARGGRYEVDAIEIGPDDEVLAQGRLPGTTAFSRLVEHMRPYSPEWAAAICDVPAVTMRRIANEFIDHACVGETIEIEGQTMPFRPVAITLG